MKGLRGQTTCEDPGGVRGSGLGPQNAGTITRIPLKKIVIFPKAMWNILHQVEGQLKGAKS
jgi:hypothetical protein